MGWIVRQEPEEEHFCEPPRWPKSPFPMGTKGDVWRCDECGRLWCYRQLGWFEASVWSRWKYRHQGWTPTPTEEEVLKLAQEYGLPMVGRGEPGTHPGRYET